MRRKPRVAVSAQMEYRARPSSMVGYPTSTHGGGGHPSAGRAPPAALGSGPMPNGFAGGNIARYDTHRRTPSAPRVQGSLHPTSPQSPRINTSYFPPHSPSHSPRSGSPCSPEVMLSGGRLVAGGIYSASGVYGDGSELDYDGDRSTVSGMEMRPGGYHHHTRTGSADTPLVRLAKTSGARVSRGNIIE
ncbi:hypothetical protein SYNPS1DRAFT_23406, partial [Syncephalis pseudoplumigaleata]